MIFKYIYIYCIRQNDNGGWGETYKACVNKLPQGGPEDAAEPAECYGGGGGSGVVQTAWAVLGLITARVCRPEEVRVRL